MMGAIQGINPAIVSRIAANIEPVPAISVKESKLAMESNTASTDLVNKLIQVGSMQKVGALQEETVGQAVDIFV